MRNVRYIVVCSTHFTLGEVRFAYEAAVIMHGLRERNVSQWRIGAYCITLVFTLMISTVGYNVLKHNLGDAASAAVVAAAIVAGLLVRELKEIGMEDEIRRRNAWSEAINKLLSKRYELERHVDKTDNG